MTAVMNHDSATIFDWLMQALSHQGISDAVADQYISHHGNVTWAEVNFALATTPSCSKLDGYWAFNECGYQKGNQTYAVPAQFSKCPLPWHPLRNGRLNQTAYSLSLFIRDVAGGNLVAWIDRQLGDPSSINDLSASRAALIEPLRHVYGISDKVIAMALSSLLVGAGRDRTRWFEVGTSFVVVDTSFIIFSCERGFYGRFRQTIHMDLAAIGVAAVLMC